MNAADSVGNIRSGSLPSEATLLITPAVNNDLTLALVVIVALAFDFTNGFHDTGNAMATSIATGALPPRVAVLLSGALNLVGAFLSFSVAATIASGLVSTGAINLTVVLAGLCGGITWNLLTWYFGIPSSSSHALIGGVVGATLAAAGSHAVKWHGLVSKVIIPGVLSPFIALGIAAVGTWCACTGSPRGCRRGPARTASGSARSARPPWCRWPTAPTTPRRPWASSPWP